MKTDLEPFQNAICNDFFAEVHCPLVLVSTLPDKCRETVVRFLLSLNAPVYLEAISGLREDPRLQHLRISNPDTIFRHNLYPLDGILRLGGVPTPRLWRDLETKKGIIKVLSISHLPFSGLSWGGLVVTETYRDLPHHSYQLAAAGPLFEKERLRKKNQEALFKQFPLAEQSLIHKLSGSIPAKSLVYLGNSLPIREWDLFATHARKELDVFASRGLNGIDGQLSTFLGMCAEGRDHWGLFGDLTTLYDLAAPWIVPQLEKISFQIVVINNGGGMIFERRFSQESFLNKHSLSFEPFANLWGMDYERCEEPNQMDRKLGKKRLIEIAPDEKQTASFWEMYSND